MATAVLYHNMVAPYRHALFEELAQQIDVEVWYALGRTRDRSWSATVPASYSYPYRFLQSRVIYAFHRPIIFCPQIVGLLRDSGASTVIAVLTRSNALDTMRICRYGRRRGVPILLWVGALEAECFHDGLPPPVSWAFERYHRWALRRAAGYIYYCGRSRAWAERRGARGPWIAGTQVLGPGPEAPRLVPLPRTEVVGLFVGKLEYRKGFDLVLAAASRLDAETRVRLCIRVVGDGPQRGLLKETPRDLRVEYLGIQPRERLWDLYRDADFVVLPSRHDPWGFVTNEAMSMGTPVLASRQAGSSELASAAGWVFDACEEGALLPALQQAIREARSSMLRRAAVEAEQRYRPEAAARVIAELVSRVSASRAKVSA